MNRRLAARPVDARRKLPIPFAQLMRADGGTDFSALDGQHTLRCARERLCGLCGQPQAYWIAFIGGPGSVDSRTWSDPPMHVECAEDAFTLCPHLARPLVPRRPSSDAVGVHAGFSEAKPERWALYVTRAYTWSMRPVTGGGTAPSFQAAPAKTIRWWAYENGRAVETR